MANLSTLYSKQGSPDPNQGVQGLQGIQGHPSVTTGSQGIQGTQGTKGVLGINKFAVNYIVLDQ